MNETYKTLKLWGDLENSIIKGCGIDIGCGSCPITQNVCRFDLEHGDANEITKYVSEQFDFVFSSHCLEHMNQPKTALLEWWKLVKPGGHLIFIVPDEDLYEQGVFPSRFNKYHKFTFTISKSQSWSPASINVLDLALSLPNSQLISVVLQDNCYDRSMLRHGADSRNTLVRFVYRLFRSLKEHFGIRFKYVDKILACFIAIDQTAGQDAVAQIQCIVKKKPE